VQHYEDLFGIKKTSVFSSTTEGTDSDAKAEHRVSNAQDVTNTYYNLATDFYEYGWGLSFHFAPRFSGESLRESIKRHEHYLALRLGLKAGDKVVDLGCGVGGPMIEIARFTDAKILGINNNEYQISRGRMHLKNHELLKQCDFLKADFRDLQGVKNETFDSAYTIEAECHVSDKINLFKEVNRVLKPGGLLGIYDWMMTDLYDPNNADHVRIKKGIELGNGIADLPLSSKIVTDALEAAGFEVLENRDLSEYDDPNPCKVLWWQPLAGGWRLQNLRTSGVGQLITHFALVACEKVKIVPEGTVKMHLILTEAANALVGGGQKKIFTTLQFILARKK